ncbi:MAG: hypothetical protein B7Z30_05975 [Rhizobiales bacterium 12-68-15]|nr:MAG: hypothetical protein B7Z30_05975 [Rhizobiales bacterium 12-68-15]
MVLGVATAPLLAGVARCAGAVRRAATGFFMALPAGGVGASAFAAAVRGAALAALARRFVAGAAEAVASAFGALFTELAGARDFSVASVFAGALALAGALARALAGARRLAVLRAGASVSAARLGTAFASSFWLPSGRRLRPVPARQARKPAPARATSPIMPPRRMPHEPTAVLARPEAQRSNSPI